MNRSDTRDGLMSTIGQWCGVKKTSGSLQQDSDLAPNRAKHALEPNRRHKLSCPEPATAPNMGLATLSSQETNHAKTHNIIASYSKARRRTVQDNGYSSLPTELLTVSGLNESGITAGFHAIGISSSPRSGLRGDSDLDLGVDQSGASVPTPESRVRKRGVTFQAAEFLAIQSSPRTSRSVSVDMTPCQTTLAPPSGGRKRLPNGRCRRFSDAMEYRQQVRLRRASCSAEVSPRKLSSSVMSPLSCSALPLSDVISGGCDVSSPGTSSRRQQNSSSTRPSPKSLIEMEHPPDARGSTGHEQDTGRVRQLLRKLDAVPVSVLGHRSRQVTWQRPRHRDVPHVGGGSGDGGGGDGKGGGVRVRSQSLSAVEAPRQRRAEGGIVCANSDIIHLHDNFGTVPSGSEKAKIDNRSIATGDKKNKCKSSTIGGSVVPWQGDDMVVNVGVLGRAMEQYLSESRVRKVSGSLGSEDK